MEAVYFNTKAFEPFYNQLNVTTNSEEAILLVLGAKKPDLSLFPNLKALYRFGVGSDNVPFFELEKRNIPVFFPSQKAKEVLFESTANFTLYLLLKSFFDRQLGTISPWVKADRPFLGEKTLLVVGTGNIGSRVAKKAAPLMNVQSYDVIRDSADSLKTKIEQADFISLHIPLSQDNQHFIDSEKLSWMKDDAVLINTARGPLIDEHALKYRMGISQMRLAFDVFWEEPYLGWMTDHEWVGRILLTPHTSSQTHEFIREGLNDILAIINQ